MKVIIIGAGVGGLVAAILLKRKGYDVEIFERDEIPRTVGAGLVLWPNATKLLSKKKLFEALFLDAISLDAMNTYDHQGTLLSTYNIDELEKNMEGYPALPIARKTMHQHLLKIANRLEINIFYEQAAEKIHRDNGKSIVTFENGSSLSADLIIGADGRMQSIAREYVNGENKPIYMGYVNWVGLVDNSLDIEKSISDYWGKGKRFGVVPLSSSSCYWAGCLVMPSGSGKSRAGDKRALLDMFKSWPTPIGNIIESTLEENINKIDVYDIDPNPLWFKDNVVLLGDCAHAAGPASGQGACLAIEDAFCLVDCLCSGNELSTALEKYQDLRFPKTTRITEVARGLTRQIFETDPKKCLKRNQKRAGLTSKNQVENIVKLWR